MKIIYQLFRGGSGGDVYFERLSETMSQLNIETKIKYYPQRLEVAPFLIKSNFKNNKPYDIIHSTVDSGFAFKVKLKPLVVTAHHLVFNPLYQHYTSISQKAFHKISLPEPKYQCGGQYRSPWFVQVTCRRRYLIWCSLG